MKTVFSIFLLWLMGFGCLPSLEAQENRVRVAVSEEKEPASIKISAYDNKIVVENAPVGSKLEIYSVVGIRVKEISLKQPSGEYTVDIAKGYYIVRIGDTVRKIAIR